MCCNVTPLWATISLQNFAHVTTARLSCHVQNFVAVTSLHLRRQQNEISIEFEIRWKKSFVTEWVPGWGLLHQSTKVQFSGGEWERGMGVFEEKTGPCVNFLHFSEKMRHSLPFVYHVHIWQVFPQPSCGDTSQIDPVSLTNPCAKLKRSQTEKLANRGSVLGSTPWLRHQMETFSALLAICAGNSPVTVEFAAQRPLTWK